MDKAIAAAIALGGEMPTMNPSGKDILPIFSRVDSAMDIKDVDNGARVVQLHEWKEAALSLAESFKEDHTCTYFLNTPDTVGWSEQKKWDVHLNMMEYIVYAHLLKGLVLAAGPSYDCIALWMPPGENMDDMLTIIRSGMWRLNFQLTKEGKKRFFDEFLPLLNDTKKQVLAERDDDSWYLVYIGTRASGRGKGYARKVVEYVTCLADAQGKVCYLESSHEMNRQIYKKFGFELKKNIYLQRADEHVELDIMLREPVQKRAAMMAFPGLNLDDRPSVHYR